MTTEQKLREAFESCMTDNGKWPRAVEQGHNGCYLLSQTENAWAVWQACAEALALPTADHFPDAAKMIETAVPVGERERFEAYFAWSRKSKGANRRPNFERFEEDGTYKDDHTQRHWWTWQQALSAGDAVDAQRLDFIEEHCRCDPKMDGQHVWWPTSFNTAQLLKGPTLREALDNAIRARKDNT